MTEIRQTKGMTRKASNRHSASGLWIMFLLLQVLCIQQIPNPFRDKIGLTAAKQPQQYSIICFAFQVRPPINIPVPVRMLKQDATGRRRFHQTQRGLFAKIKGRQDNTAPRRMSTVMMMTIRTDDGGNNPGDYNEMDDETLKELERQQTRQRMETEIANRLAQSFAKEKAIMALSKRKVVQLPSSNTAISSSAAVRETSLQLNSNSTTATINNNLNSQRKYWQRKSKRDFTKLNTSRTNLRLPAETPTTSFSSTATTAAAAATTTTTTDMSSLKKPTISQVSTNTTATTTDRQGIPVTQSPEQQRTRSSNRKVSLLPPPLSNISLTDDDLTSGLSSWEEFLGQTSASSTTTFSSSSSSSSSASSQQQQPKIGTPPQLPTIRDLFPPSNTKINFDSSTTMPSIASPLEGQQESNSTLSPFSSGRTNPSRMTMQGMDGVLPVSELFYRSSQSLSQEEDEGDDEEEASTANSMNEYESTYIMNKKKKNDDDDVINIDSNYNSPADDEELPFSAEQSDSLISEDGKVHIRQNEAQQQQQDQPTPSRRSFSRKMVRRGMEMLVGGVPINVDPPQRSVELSYQFLSKSVNNDDDNDTFDWAQVITLNTRDFGPLLHHGSISQVTQVERGLYCESFVHSAIKWDVCHKDFRDIVKQHYVKQQKSKPKTTTTQSSLYTRLLDDTKDLWSTRSTGTRSSSTFSKSSRKTSISSASVGTKDKNMASTAGDILGDNNEMNEDDRTAQAFMEHPNITFQYQFEIRGISKEELDSITDPVSLERVFLRAIGLVVRDKLLDEVQLVIDRLLTCQSLDTMNDEASVVSFEFHFEAEGREESVMPIAQSLQPILTASINDGTFADAMVVAATEQSWFQEVVDEMSQDWEFVSHQNERVVSQTSTTTEQQPRLDFNPNDGNEIGMQDDEDSNDDDYSDLFLGGGNDGVFFDYSESNRINAPFQGQLGPLLLDAAIERAKQRYPRVIAIGDVHGCIDELQDLLRLCDYQPGDLVCFLGDLVCKGPDSISVVQMAREIGAIGIRGNHDFEVVRWYQAIQSGVDPPVVGSEHFHIASCLSKADMKWLYSLPWFISSKDLGALFVHAGFVAGIRLAKQNPRLMMNMRSILPDGTVTSKFFSNWPWARLWDGPQTVLFGHDADRGLQQYEHAIGLDTGCVYGGRLTACILPEKRLVSVSARREYFKYRRRHYD